MRTAPTHITASENSAAWKTQRAGTASEPTHLSFSHYIAAAYSEEASEVDAATRSVPYEMGWSPEDWEVISDFQLLKNLGVYEVERMRTIALMAPLFNMNNKKLGRDTMKVAETAEALPDDQNGSRKDRRSNIVVTDETVVNDISRQLRLPMAGLDLDLSEGYDRMLHNATMPSMIQHVAPEPAVYSTFETLANAEHYVLTAHGRSTQSYGGRAHNRAGKPTPQGVGQGSGKGPTAFGTYSSTIIKAMRKKGYGAMFSACISMFVMTFVCFMYVDDTKLLNTAKSQEDMGEEIVTGTQC